MKKAFNDEDSMKPTVAGSWGWEPFLRGTGRLSVTFQRKEN